MSASLVTCWSKPIAAVDIANFRPGGLAGYRSAMLEHPKDIQARVSAMKFVERLAATEPLSQYCGELFSPTPDEDWAKFARSTYTSYFHGVGTCKMGPTSDPMAVVDQHLRVHGMENLWIGDASCRRCLCQYQSHLHDDRPTHCRLHQNVHKPIGARLGPANRGRVAIIRRPAREMCSRYSKIKVVSVRKGGQRNNVSTIATEWRHPLLDGRGQR
jgi:hypothetical protein